MQTDPEILFDRRGAAGLVTLNRPQALNAVNHAMVRALTTMLIQWADDPGITRVIIRAAGGRAFSAGGDIRHLYDLGRAGDHAAQVAFMRDEYRLDALIKHYRKPYVALIDGIVMGGGVGISIHGSHRVAGDGFRFAMPEVGIGFFPDVGATWILPRLPGELGTYCALTGARLGPEDATAAGIASHRVESAKFDDLLDDLCGTISIDALLSAFAESKRNGPVTDRLAAIERLFSGTTVEQVLAALDREAGALGADGGFAAETAAAIRAKSPISLKIALAQMRRGRSLSFDECLRTEYRIVSRVVHGHDLYEGVRAVIIDKDQKPTWQPHNLAAVTQADVDRHFAPLAEGELELP